jgi:hypothetical protein
MKYYTSINRFTEIKKQAWMIDQLIPDYDFLFSAIKSILIHPMDAKKVKYDRKNKGIFHCLNSTVETMFTYERLEKYLDEKKIPLNTIANDRAVLSCDHHALMLTSFFRYLDIPIRCRTGYCKYIVKGLTIPHWVTEVYNTEIGEWVIMDPERKIKNADRQQFLFAAQVWAQHMESGRKFSSYSGLSGKQGLKMAVLCDLNCIFKNELLSYEWRLKAHKRKKPEMAHTSYERLSDVKRNQFDQIAKYMLKPDLHMDELWRLYQEIVEEQDLMNSGYAGR